MLKIDITQVQGSGDTFFSSTDTAYLIFMVIGIIGYFTVPGVANYIVHAGGGNALLQKVNTLVSHSSNSMVSAGASNSGMFADALGDQRGRMTQGMAAFGNSSGYFNGGNQNGSKFNQDKLSGN
jgi:hypothetical protein